AQATTSPARFTTPDEVARNSSSVLARTGPTVISILPMVNDDVPADRADPDDEPRWRLTPTKIAVALILLTAIVVPLLTSSYARDEPRLFGFPFFYWYQFLWVFLAAIACWVS